MSGTVKAQRPDWPSIYGYPIATERPNALLTITRRSAALALSALQQRIGNDAYHTDIAAAEEITAALSAPAPTPATSDWSSDMDAAPRDGTEVDLWVQYGSPLGEKRYGRVPVASWSPQVEAWVNASGWWIERDDNSVRVTHWRRETGPLPTPPAPEAGR